MRRWSRKMIALVLALLAVSAAILYWRTSRAAYESAPYRVASAEGNFEIREYDALVLAETPLAGGEDGQNGGFRRLFRFITGANAAQQKIAMTTPVFIHLAPAEERMAFVLPARWKLADAPQPAEAAVDLRQAAPARYAVLRFSGWSSARDRAAAYARLQEWLREKGLAASGNPLWAYYDPPWTPPFWRRNEVLLPIPAPAAPAEL